MPDTYDADSDVLGSPELIERLAAIEHDRWSHWQRYMHAKCTPGGDGSLIIPRELAERWAEQMTTPYDDLPEEQRVSDREQVARYLPVIKQALLSGLDA